MAELFPNQGGFDADAVEPDEFDGTHLPAGEYVVRITDSDVQNTKAGDGKFIVFEFTVDEGDFTGRKFWTNINIVNKNPKAQKIGAQQLKKIVEACGVPSPLQNTEQLHNIPFRATTKVRPADERFDAKTEFKNAKPYNASSAPKQKPATNGSASQPAASPPAQKQPAAAAATKDDEVPWG